MENVFRTIVVVLTVAVVWPLTGCQTTSSTSIESTFGYVGEFKDGKPHGHGVMTLANGGHYVGELVDGKPHGEGRATYPSGKKVIVIYENGILVSEKPDFPSNTKIAKQKLDEEKFQRGSLAVENENFSSALRELRPLAEQGHPHSQFLLAVMYNKGDGVPQDLNKSFKWAKLAAEQGFRRAQHYIAKLYRIGKGVPKDIKRSIHWYKIAAKQGMASAQFDLGVLYVEGKRNIPRDISQSYMYLKLAALQDFAGAKKNAQIIKRKMTPFQIEQARKDLHEWQKNWPKLDKTPEPYLANATVEKTTKRKASPTDIADINANIKIGFLAAKSGDFSGALKILKPLADNGNKEAQHYIGNLFEFGRGVSQNFIEARKWYLLSAQQGHVTSQVNLGMLFSHGKGGSKNYKKANKWWQIAAEQGDGMAMKNLGLSYEKGYGVQSNKVRAYMWLSMSVLKGQTISKKYVARVLKTMNQNEIQTARDLGIKCVKMRFKAC
jgi:TPR repeat protein